jgi:hypothetical protein
MTIAIIPIKINSSNVEPVKEFFNEVSFSGTNTFTTNYPLMGPLFFDEVNAGSLRETD